MVVSGRHNLSILHSNTLVLNMRNLVFMLFILSAVPAIEKKPTVLIWAKPYLFDFTTCSFSHSWGGHSHFFKTRSPFGLPLG